MEWRITADKSTWSPQAGLRDCAAVHYINFKLGIYLTGPKLDVKSTKRALFIALFR